MANYDSFLKTALAKYQNAELTKNVVSDVMKIFSDLRPKLESAKCDDGITRNLLQLQGTIPIVYKGATYDTPIAVWILETYPSQAPIVYVIPTSSMHIHYNDNVDQTGKVHTQYLNKWRYPSSDMVGLLLDMARIFGENPPLTTAVPNIAKANQTEELTNLNLENYQNAVFTRQEAIHVVSVYEHLTPVVSYCSFQDGTKIPLLQLEGTIPVMYKCNIYNIPVCIYLMENHPYEGPVVYVKPTTNMRLYVNRHVDEAGRVYMPYLSEWNYPNSDLLSLIQNLSVMFGNIPPVYSSSVTHQPSDEQTNIVLPVVNSGIPTSNHVLALSTLQSAVGSTVSKFVIPRPLVSLTPRLTTGRPSNSGQNEGIRETKGEVAGKNVPATAPQDFGQVPGRRNTAKQTDENCLGSTEDFEIHCDPCYAENNFVEAEGFCKQCKEYYCKACLRYHSKIAATKNHAIVSKDKMPKY